MVSFSLGALSGVTPDLFGGRDGAPWSHSIFFTPVLVVWMVFIVKRLMREVRFTRLWAASILAVWVGHLMLDLMGHDVPLLFPFSDKSFVLGVITLGDPWIWLPLTIGIAISFGLKFRTKLPVMTAILFVLLYLMLKLMAKEIIAHKVEAAYPVSEQSHYIIEPDTYLEYTFQPAAWLKYRYRIVSEHHVRGGRAGWFGEKLGGVSWHYFHPEGLELMRSRGVVIAVPRANKDISITVTDEWAREGVNYIQGKAEDTLYTYKEVTDGQWIKVDSDVGG